MTPELFAQSLCEDFNVPSHHFVPKIVAAIVERAAEYRDQVLPILQRVPDDACRGQLDPDGEAAAVFRRAREGSEEVKTESGHEDEKHVRIDGCDDETGEERPMTVDEAMACLSTDAGEELRILIKVGGIEVVSREFQLTRAGDRSISSSARRTCPTRLSGISIRACRLRSLPRRTSGSSVSAGSSRECYFR